MVELCMIVAAIALLVYAYRLHGRMVRPDPSVKPFHERCQREMTASVIFLLQHRRFVVISLPLGFEYGEDGIVQKEDEDGKPLGEPIQWRVFDLWKRYTDNVVAYWETESVWLDRETAEAWARAHEYNYPDGWLVYGLPAKGILSNILKYT